MDALVRKLRGRCPHGWAVRSPCIPSSRFEQHKVPRGFSEHERAFIRTRLVEAARTQFSRFGYRKASVEDMARAAGISKGSFYLFFESKAAAFMAAAEAVESELRSRFEAEVAEVPSIGNATDRLRHLFAFHLEALGSTPFLRVALDPEETAALFRELPPALLEAHSRADNAFIEGVLSDWRRDGFPLAVAPATLTAVLKALYVVKLNEDIVGGGQVGDVLARLVEGAARALADPGRS